MAIPKEFEVNMPKRIDYSPIRQSLEIVKQFILRADENIDETGLWQAYLKIVEFIKNTEEANTGVSYGKKE